MSTSDERPVDRARGAGLARWLIIVAGAFILLIVAGTITLKVLFPAEKLRAMVVPRIEEKVGSEVQLADLGLRVFPRVAVRLDQLAIANPPGFSSEPALRLDALELQVRLWPLLRKQFELRQVRLVRPVIRYEVLADGTSNLSMLGPESAGADAGAGEGEGAGAAAGAAFVVSDLAIREGSVVYIDQRSGRAARFGIDARLSSERAPGSEGALQGRGTIELSSIRTLTPEAGADSVAIPDVEIGYALFADLPGDSLALQELQLDMAGISAGGSGVVRGLMHERSIDFALESNEIDIAEMLASLPTAMQPQAVAAAGRSRLSLRVMGPIGEGAQPEVNGTVRLDDVSASYGEYGQALTGGAGALTFDLGSLSLPSFEGRLYDRPFELQLAVTDFETKNVNGRVSGEVDLARLAELREGAATTAGIARFDLSFSGPADQPGRLRVTGPVQLADISYQNESLAVPARIAAATVRLTGTGIVAEEIPVRMGDSDLNISFSSQRLLEYALSRGESDRTPHVEFAVTSDRLDLSELTVADTTQPGYSELLTARLAGKQVDGVDPGELARDRYAPPPLPPISADGRVRIGELVNPPTRAQNISFQVIVRNGVLELRGIDAAVYGGRLGGALSLDFSDGRPPFALRYDLQLGGGRAGDFVQRWTRLGRAMTGLVDFNVSGTTSIDETLLPAPDAIDAAGSASFTRGRFEEFGLTQALANQFKVDTDRFSSFDQLGGVFEIKNGAFLVQDWQLVGGDVTAGIGGSAGLGGSLDLSLALQLPMETLQAAGMVEGGGALGNLLGQLAGDDEAINVAIGIGGTMTNPVLQLDSEALQEELAKRLEGEGSDLLRRIIK